MLLFNTHRVFRLNLKYCHWLLVVLASLSASLGTSLGRGASTATAQVIPDSTLGSESTQVLIDGTTVDGSAADLIYSGAQRDANLFHSFEHFSIDEGQQVYFRNPADVERIFSRVTGSLPSDIFGTLGVDGGADLFLLNPNGILFGPNARLDVSGSFVASTADSFMFADSSEFRAAFTDEVPLLTVDVPLGIQFNTSAQGSIDSFGQLLAGGDLSLQGGKLYVEGQLSAGGNLTLISNEVTSGDAYFRSDSNLQILTTNNEPGSFTSTHSPVISAGGDVLFGSYSGVALQVEAAGNITAGSINTSNITGEAGGDIVLEAKGDIVVTGSFDDPFAFPVSLGSFSYSEEETSDRGGKIEIFAGGDAVVEGGIDSYSYSDYNDGSSKSGNGGIIKISAGGDAVVEGGIDSSTSSYSNSETSPSESGSGGAIELVAGGDAVVEGGIDSSSNSLSGSINDSESGSGGTIELVAEGDVTVEGSIDSFSDSSGGSSRSGDGGAIAFLSNTGDIQLIGLSESDLIDEPSSSISSFSFAEADTEPGTAGNSGTTSLKAPAGSVIGSDTRITTIAISPFGGSTGAGGDVHLEAASSISGLEILTLADGGNSGNVIVRGGGDRLVIENLSLTTSGQSETPDPLGPGGPVVLDASNLGQSGNTFIYNAGNIFLDNVNIEASANGSRPAGDITIDSPGLVSLVNSQITSNANNDGAAGTVFIDAGQFRLGNNGRIFATTSGAGNGGSVIINATDAVFLGDRAQGSEPIVSVEASGAGRPGDIVIDTPTFVLSEAARITATATETATSLVGGGSISLNANQMNIAGTVGIFAETQGQSPGGTLTLQPYQSSPDLNIAFAEGAVVSASTSGVGQGGNIRLLAPDSITITGPGRLAVETQSAGDGGDIELRTRQLVITDRVELSASTSAGLVPVYETVIIENTELVDAPPEFKEKEDAGQTLGMAQTASDQPGVPLNLISGSLANRGDVDLYQIYITGDGTFSASTVDKTQRDTQLFLFNASDGTGIYSNDDDPNCGGCYQSTLPAGHLLAPSEAGVYYLAISSFRDDPVNSSGNVIFPNGFNIDFGAVKVPLGPGGQSRLAGWTGFGSEVGDYAIQLSGVAQDPGPIEVTTITEVERISDFIAPGDAGDINVFADDFTLADGSALQTNTLGLGDAGDINLSVDNSLTIDNSAVTSSTLSDSQGAGGNITANVPTTTLRNSGIVAVDSQGEGEGGQVRVIGDQLSLSEGSRIGATTLSSDGGNLIFDLQELLLLQGDSELSATAGIAGAGGDGGNISIDTQFLIAAFSEDNNITANAFDGDGGNVTIVATDGILGIEPRSESTSQNDITASSQNGVSGSIAIQSPEVDLSQSLTELPATFASPEVTRSCRDTLAEGNEFTISGRGGLSQTPLDPVATAIWQDILPIATTNSYSSQNTPFMTSDAATVADSISTTVPAPIVETQGWIRDKDGQVVLVAEVPQQTVISPLKEC